MPRHMLSRTEHGRKLNLGQGPALSPVCPHTVAPTADSRVCTCSSWKDRLASASQARQAGRMAGTSARQRAAGGMRRGRGRRLAAWGTPTAITQADRQGACSRDLLKILQNQVSWVQLGWRAALPFVDPWLGALPQPSHRLTGKAPAVSPTRGLSVASSGSDHGRVGLILDPVSCKEALSGSEM